MITCTLLCFLSSVLPWSIQDRVSTKPQRCEANLLVVDPRGSAVRQATVRLLADVSYDRAGQTIAEDMECRADESGVCRPLLHLGRPYVAWAWLADGPDGYRASPAHGRVFAGGSRKLVVSDVVRPRCRLRLSGLERWERHGPLALAVTFEVQDGVANAVPWLVVESPLSARPEAIFMPPLPGNRFLPMVFSASGVPVSVHEPFDLGRKEVELLAAKPVELSVMVVDRETRRPIPGATVEGLNALPFGLRQGRVCLATSRDDGTAHFRVGVLELGGQSVRVPLSVQGLRHAERRLFVDVSVDERREDVEVALERGGSIRGRLMLDGTRPAAHVRLSCHGGSMWPGSFELDQPTEVLTDASGGFVIAGREAEHNFQLLACLRHEDMPLLPEPGNPPLGPLAVLATGRCGETADLDLGTIRFDQMTALDVAVVGADGSPAAFPAVYIASGTREGPSSTPLGKSGRLFGDARGRVRILAASLTPLVIGAMGEDGGVGLRAVDEASKDPSGGIGVAIRLGEPIRVKGVVRDESGRLIAEALVRVRHAIDGVMPWNEAMPELLADREGRFEFTATRGYRYGAHASGESQGRYVSGQTEFEPTTKPIEVVVKARR